MRKKFVLLGKRIVNVDKISVIDVSTKGFGADVKMDDGSSFYVDYSEFEVLKKAIGIAEVRE